jgi:capsular exopolysaccharide synthesis family protein
MVTMPGSILSNRDNKGALAPVSSSNGQNFLSLADGITLEVRDNVLLERWRVLRRHLPTLLVLGLLGAIFGFAASSLQSPAYQASTLLEIQEVNEDFLNLKSVTPIAQDPAAVSVDEIQTYIRRLQSRSLLTPVVEKLGLVRAPGRPGLLGRVRQSFGHDVTPIDPLERSIDEAQTNLQIREIGRSRMLEIAFTSDTAVGSAAFANALAGELLEQNLQSRGTLTQNVSEWINHQLNDTRANLVKSEQALEDYTRRTGLLYLNGNSGNSTDSASASLSTEKLRQVQEELSRAEADRISKESQYMLAKTASLETLPFLSSDAAIRVQQDKLTDLRRQKAELGTNYTPRYATMRSIEAQINVLQDALTRERVTILSQIQNDYLAALGREKLLLRQYSGQSKLVNEESVKAVEYQMLKREVESNRQLYDDMLQRTKQASVAAALRANNIRIVDAARVPIAPYKPNPPVNTALGMIGGFFLGAIWISVFKGQGKITQPGELKGIAGVSELGAIQSAKAFLKQRHTWEIGTRYVSDEDRLLARLALVTSNWEPSAAAQSYRSILTSLRLSDRYRECRVIALTSPGAVEGKTTVLTGLGVVLARMQQRVLLVDGDLYKPELHERLDVRNERGLADLLRLPERSRARLSEFIQATGIPNLSLLAGGSGGPAPLLFSGRLKEIFREFRETYDFVLVDTPPMLQIADARVLGKHADSVILIVRSGRTSREAVLLSLERLHEDGVPVLGTVLNDWNPSSTDPNYYPAHYRGSNSRKRSDSQPEVRPS